MADWSLIRTTLATWVTDITGLTCYWRRRPRGPHFGEAYALLDIAGRRTVGRDQIETEYDVTGAAGEEIRQYQVGQRQFTFNIQVRCRQASDDVDALNYTSLIRDSVNLIRKTKEVFDDADIAFARILAETDLSYELDGRESSVAQIDLLLNAAALTEDDPTGYIETLEDVYVYDPENTAVPLWQGDIEAD